MAEGVAADVAAAVTTSLIRKAVTQTRYVYSFNNFVESLEKEKRELITKQDSIKGHTERARRRTETIDAEVQKWLKDAQKLVTEVGELQEKINMHNAARCCPNCIQRYRLGKGAARKTEELRQHKGNCNFSVFARLSTLRGMDYYSYEGFISFESRKHAYNQITEALKNEGIHRIGLYGMGGCGKTTLVKEVGKEAEELGLFDKVLIVVVSNNPDTKKIQTSIAGSLGFKFEVEEEGPERARRLSMALTNGGKILVMLDDVWERLNFEAIGIPNSCNILLTTREFSVCRNMECQKVIALSVLDPLESWILFQKHAGISDDNFDTFKDVGQEIANECKGLPVAIATVASSLKGEELDHWEVARDTLRDFGQGEIGPALDDIYKCLKLSYDNLREEGVKSLFLLCSLFPEDFEFSEEFLARIAMGLGLFRKVQSNEGIRKQVSVAMKKLINSCLLLKGLERDTVKMHDLVHDIALQIAKAEDKLIIGIERSKQKLEEILISNNSQIRYLFCEMDKLLLRLNSPKLECLIIYLNSDTQVEAPDDFFNGMKELRVLGLFYEDVKFPNVKLLKSIELLRNLRCLMLVGSKELCDMYFLVSLLTIEAITLENFSFHELPDGVVNLKNLRLMELENCQIEKNPCDVIRRCSQLEELYFVGNKYPTYKGESSFDCSKFKLQRYHIEIGTGLKEFNYNDYSIKRYLSIESFDDHFSDATFVDLIRRAEVLYLGEIYGGCKTIIPDFVYKIGDGMNELTMLLVKNSDEVECLVDMTNSFQHIGPVFSNLTYLEISQMEHLEELFLGQPHHGLLQKLEELHISECNQLKHIIANEPEIISDGDNPRSYDSVFTKLKVIDIMNCQELKYIMPASLAKGLLKLENLHIKAASQMKYLFSQSSNLEDEGQLCNQNQNEFHIINFEALKSLTLENMPNIISICLENYYPKWPSLDSLHLRDCPLLKSMFDDSEFRKQDHTLTKNGIFCNLTELYFHGLDCLETLFVGSLYLEGFKKLGKLSIWRCNHLKHLIANDVEKTMSDGKIPSSCNSVFSKLKEITIKCCHKLEYLMPISFVMGLLQLENVNIEGASKLKYLFDDSNHNQFHMVKLEALKSLTLEDMPNIISICPENYYPIWPSLDSMQLRDCPKFKIMPGDSEFKQLDHTFKKELRAAMVSYVQNLKSLSVFSNNEVNGLFHLQGFPIDGQKVTAGLTDLDLYLLPELKHIWNGPKQFLSLQNLQSLKIENCQKLEVVFSASILRSLNQLEVLQIIECQELHQIFEVDGKNKEQSNPLLGQVCLPKLTILIVQQCNKLKFLLSLTTSFELPKLKFLIIKEASELEEVITCQKGDKAEQVQVMFPKLEHVVLVQLPKLHEVYRGIELETVRHRVVHHCPKLPLMLSATLENLKEMYQEYYYKATTYDEDTAFRWIKNIVSDLLESRNEDIGDENPLHTTPSASNNEPAQESVGIVLDQKIPVIATSTNEPEFASRLNPSHLAIPLHTTPSVELMKEESLNGIISMDPQEGIKETMAESDQEALSINLEPTSLPFAGQQPPELVQNAPTNEPLLMAKEQALEQNKVAEMPKRTSETSKPSNRIERTVEAGLPAGPKREKIGIAPLSIDLEPRNQSPEPLFALQNPSLQSIKGHIKEVPTKSKATSSQLGLPQAQNRVSQIKAYNHEDANLEPTINLQAFDGALVDLFQSMVEDEDVQASMPSTSVISANKPDMEDKSVAKALVDLQVSLKMPLENIASSEAETLCLENVLNFLSSNSCLDGAMSDGLKAAIDSLSQDFHSILSSFKQASATIVRFALLEEKEKTIKGELPQRMESAFALMNEIQQKEASVMEQISKLQDELSLLQEQKKKCIADTRRFKSQFENVKKSKSQMMEDHIKSREELLEVDHKWSTLCSQFEQNFTATRNMS